MPADPASSRVGPASCLRPPRPTCRAETVRRPRGTRTGRAATEPDHPLDLLAYLGVRDIEIRLVLVEAVQVVLDAGAPIRNVVFINISLVVYGTYQHFCSLVGHQHFFVAYTSLSNILVQI